MMPAEPGPRSLPEPPPAALCLKLDRDALAANWRALDRLSGAARAGAAVKADGYGLGARRVVEVLAGEGCGDFFVAHWREAAPLLDLIDPARLAVLHGPLNAAEADYAKATGLRPVINSVAQARRWREAGGGLCDLMVDTAMNRLGVGLAELGDEAVQALDIDLLHSHLVSAEQDLPLNALQRERWEEARRALPHCRAAIANSAGIALGADFHGELTRPGLSLYGGVPCAALAPHIRQVARPQAVLIQARDLAAGDCVGYDSIFTAPRAMRIGTIALGYADGYLVCWSECGAMLHQGRRLPVLGRVSMDMTVIDLTAAPDLTEGDWVEVEYALAPAARATGLSQYELLTGLGRRFAR
ncbi:MAG: alanine racemase [Novosphingobium sp.]